VFDLHGAVAYDRYPAFLRLAEVGMIWPLRFSAYAAVHLEDTFLSDVIGYVKCCGLFSVSNQDTNADAAVVWAAGVISFTVISGPPDLSLTVSPTYICALSAMLHSSALVLRLRQSYEHHSAPLVSRLILASCF
jgi:hypothetical protein